MTTRYNRQLDVRPFQLYVPVPPMLAEALGYTGQVFGHPLDARWVGFYCERRGDEAIYNDGRASGTGEYTGYLAFLDHPKVGHHTWYAALYHFNWTCQICHIQNYLNKDRSKPKMEVDHVKALYRGGLTEWNNLQVLCAPCNKRKGVN
jgi:hypothetical protein